MDRSDMPIGFAMALAMNPEAMQAFAAMNESQKQQLIDGTHTVKSKDEMHRYVNSILYKKETDTKA